MGVVHEAVEDATGHRVAIKLTRAGEQPTARRTFLREARAARAARHPGLLPLHAAGEHEGWLYLVMDLVEGDNLQDVLDIGGPLPPREAATLVARVAAAAHALHRAGVVHGDIKPANVLLRPDHGGRSPLLSDFGLAGAPVDAHTFSRLSSDPRWLRSADGTDGAGRTDGEPFSGGTYTYMAPEQWRSDPPDARCDVYALGGLLFAALTGRRPYHDRVLLPQLMHAVLFAEPPRPSALVPGLPAELDRVVATAMAKEPGRRYASAAELAAVLTCLADGTDCGQPPGGRARTARGAAAGRLRLRGLPTKVLRPPGRLSWAAALLVAVAAGGFGSYALLGPGRTTAAPQQSAGAATAQRHATAHQRTVCARDLDLRATPGHGGHVVAVLRHGQPVTVLREDDRRVWVYVRAAHDHGWVLAQWLGQDC
jgi:hypothetical protein